jgi:farnesyl-diphosphate farnesyltransferase
MFKPENKTKAMYATSQMVLNALQKAPDVIFYLAGLREQSVFNFAAIPQSMAIATLDVCFHNPAILEKNVKITKGQACRLMLDSTQNLQVLCGVFKEYARSIAKKNDPRDPNFIEISIACGKVYHYSAYYCVRNRTNVFGLQIEQFIETIFPSQKPGIAAANPKYANAADEEKARKEAEEAKWDTIYMGLAVLGVLAFVTGLMVSLCCRLIRLSKVKMLKCLQLWCAWMAGARFDIMFHQLKQGVFLPPKNAEQTAKVKAAFEQHGEL